MKYILTVFVMSATAPTATATAPTATAPAPVCPGAPQKTPLSTVSQRGVIPIRLPNFGNNTTSSGTPLGDHPQLSPSMRSDQTPPQSPTGSPACPGAPRVLHRVANPPPTWGSVLPMDAVQQ